MKYYVPCVPAYVDKYLKYEKQHDVHALALCCGEEYKQYKLWKKRYSRKFKYAMLNGWSIEN